jgi:two-component system, OmpR family, copper resistance phosphate regulon response regulator CusR
MRILIAEDDPALASFVKKGLEAEHYAVDVSGDGEQARSLAGELDFDLVVLDLNLPRLDGVSLLRQVRTRKPSMPILILTGRTRVEDRVQCLDLGADDYLAKPFSFTELSARIRALMRRSHLPVESVLIIDDLKLDRVERRVERAGKRIELTSKEFALLEYLMRNAGRRMTRAMIIEHVWNLSFDTCTNVVDVYVNYSSAQVDKRKVGRLAIAIQAAFQELGAFPTSSARVPVDSREPMPFNTVQTMRNIERTTALDRVVATPDRDPASVEEDGDLSELRRELERALAPEIARKAVALRSVPDGLVISLLEIGFFETGSAQIKSGSLSAFHRMARSLARYTFRIRIEGHTDNVPIHNSKFHSNWELSTARATELIRLLMVMYDFPPHRLSAAGYSQYHPVASNSAPEGRALNRRVDVVVLGKESTPINEPRRPPVALPVLSQGADSMQPKIP